MRGLPRGMAAIVGFHVFSLSIWFLGQTLAVFDYDRVVGWGLQDARDLVDPVIVEVNRAIGLADTLVMLPLFAIAIAGLIRRRFFGAVASWLVFGMTLYWPVVYWSSLGFFGTAHIRHQPASPATIALPAMLWLIAAWGSWYLARRRDWFR